MSNQLVNIRRTAERSRRIDQTTVGEFFPPVDLIHVTIADLGSFPGFDSLSRAMISWWSDSGTAGYEIVRQLVW